MASLAEAVQSFAELRVSVATLEKIPQTCRTPLQASCAKCKRREENQSQVGESNRQPETEPIERTQVIRKRRRHARYENVVEKNP